MVADDMRLYVFAQGLYMHCARGLNKRDFIIALINAIVDDNAKGECKILDTSPDTAYRCYSGKRRFAKADLSYVTSSLDKGKFQDWVLDSPTDVIQHLSELLKNWNIDNDGTDEDVSGKLADLFVKTLFEEAGIEPQEKNSQSVENAAGNEDISRALKKVEQIEQLIGELPKPRCVPVPDEILEDESSYINELLSAYGDAEKVEGFNKTDLPRYPEYSEDLSERRIDYFAAETIRRGVLELAHGKLAGQFDVLKTETLTGVKDTERQKHDNGYERMLAVMMQATVIPVSNYILSQSHYWISNSIKKGVCHVLVNDGKLKWVKKK